MDAACHTMPFGAECLAGGGVRFRLWAPAQEAVALVLDDATGGGALAMEPVGEGWFERITDRAGPGTRYRYRLVDGATVPDPAARAQADDVHGPSVVVDPRAYRWRQPDWRGRPWHETVLYELHVGAFSAEGSFAGAAAKLRHLAALGVTAIELMPLADFAGGRNWGYDGVLPFAPDRSYGTPEALKALIDAAHRHGLMVFLDVVYNHFGPVGNQLPRYAPQMFRHDLPTPWGAAIDFRRRPVRDFMIHNALYWVEEYRFDGLRFDAVHALRDEPASHILEEISAAIRSGPGRERHVHLVIENEANEARRLARDFDGQWNDDWHHCCHTLLTGEGDGYYAAYAADPIGDLARALAEGFVFQGEPSPRDGKPRGEPSAHLPPARFVDFLQNHDQIGNRAYGDRLSSLAPPAALEALTAILLLQPAIPMLFMGEEWGARTPFLYFTDFGDDFADIVREGRRREFARFPAFADPATRSTIPDPNAAATFEASKLDWSGISAPEHAGRLALVRRLLALRAAAITPRLPGIPGAAATARRVGATGLSARWTLGDGSVLALRANLGAARQAGLDRPGGDVLHATPGALDVAGEMPPWSLAFTLAAPA